MKYFQSLLLFLYCSFGISQQTYPKADSIAKNVRSNNDLAQLVYDLTNSLETEVEKTRAIYYWITENIAYDYKKANKGTQFIKFSCRSTLACEAKRKAAENKIIHQVLRRKQGICSEYSLLFKSMCDLAHIKCFIVDGYVKNKPQHVGKMGILNHSWNVVFIDNQNYYLDLTWASGYCTKNRKGKLNKFFKQRNDFYWFTPIEKFSIDHFPKKPEEIKNFNISKAQFLDQPYIKTNFIPNLNIESPSQGILMMKLNDTIVFKFQATYPIDKIQINTNVKRNPSIYKQNKKGEKIIEQKALEKQQYVVYKKNESTYEFYYVVTNEKLRYIDILFDHDLTIRYLIKIVP